MKTKETLLIEQVLYASLFGDNPSLAKEFGTTEVKIGFGKELREHRVKNEYVDFMSYDIRKDIFRCYEVKVSMSDFKSKANLSWYGNYNYLVLSNELYYQQSLKDWENTIPENVGIIVVYLGIAEASSDLRNAKETVKRPKFVEVEFEMKQTLKNSLLRSLFYQNNKLKKKKEESIC